jgi:hypothetical protein
MDRRQFFRLGIRNIKDTARRQAPALIRGPEPVRRLDLSILTAEPDRADALVREMLQEHFGGTLLRLRESILPGEFPGGLLLFENDEPANYHDGVSLFFAALRSIRQELALGNRVTDPRLLRYVNATPPMSRDVAIRHRHTLLATIPLAEDKSYLFTGSIGPVRVAVIDGHFRFERSLCRHQICVAHPPIIAPGQRITCVPNEITAVIHTVTG